MFPQCLQVQNNKIEIESRLEFPFGISFTIKEFIFTMKKVQSILCCVSMCDTHTLFLFEFWCGDDHKTIKNKVKT